MSATTAPIPRTLDVSATPEVPLGRLVRVEYRKALDTRAGRWFVAAILLLVLAVLVIFTFAAPDDQLDFSTYLSVAGTVLGYFLPILIILLVTAEASQRTGLVTFTLEPRRPRVVVAKFLAGFGLAITVLLLAAVVAVLGTLLAVVTGGSPEWTINGHQVFNAFVLSNTFGVLVGFAIAMLLMNTPAAIVVYFAYSLILPIAVSILSSLSSGFDKVAPWVELNTAQAPLFTGDYTPTGEQWAQLAVAAFIWLVVPLFLGISRLLRIEFK